MRRSTAKIARAMRFMFLVALALPLCATAAVAQVWLPKERDRTNLYGTYGSYVGGYIDWSYSSANANERRFVARFDVNQSAMQPAVCLGIKVMYATEKTTVTRTGSAGVQWGTAGISGSANQTWSSATQQGYSGDIFWKCPNGGRHVRFVAPYERSVDPRSGWRMVGVGVALCVYDPRGRFPAQCTPTDYNRFGYQ